jgi:hypothetical protein
MAVVRRKQHRGLPDFVVEPTIIKRSAITTASSKMILVDDAGSTALATMASATTVPSA